MALRGGASVIIAVVFVVVSFSIDTGCRCQCRGVGGWLYCEWNMVSGKSRFHRVSIFMIAVFDTFGFHIE